MSLEGEGATSTGMGKGLGGRKGVSKELGCLGLSRCFPVVSFAHDFLYFCSTCPPNQTPLTPH